MSSPVWHYFTLIPGSKKVRCNICDQNLERKDASTKSMWDHLQHRHKNEYKELKNGAGTTTEKSEVKNESKITNFLTNKINNEELADELMARIMIRQNCSFLFFENPDVEVLFKKAFPSQNLHHKDYFRTKVIPKMASKIRLQIIEEIGENFYSITTDAWSQPTKTPSLLSITLHSVNKKFERKDFVLSAIPLDEHRHTGENIAMLIEECLIEHGFSMDKLITVVRDDANLMSQFQPNYEMMSQFQPIYQILIMRISFFCARLVKSLRFLMMKLERFLSFLLQLSITSIYLVFFLFIIYIY